MKIVVYGSSGEVSGKSPGRLAHRSRNPRQEKNLLINITIGWSALAMRNHMLGGKILLS